MARFARRERGVTIRKLTPRDAPVLAEAFERLSPQSRDLRFLSAKPRLSSHDLQYLTDVDGHLHEALGAVDKATGRGVGVARFVRLDADAPVAEGRGYGRRRLAAPRSGNAAARAPERACARRGHRALHGARLGGEQGDRRPARRTRRARAQRQRRFGHSRIRSRGWRRSGLATACAGRCAPRRVGR